MPVAMAPRNVSRTSPVLDDKYVFEHEEGLWTFGSVQVLRDRATAALVTCKSIPKASLRRDVKHRLSRLCELHHDHLVQMKDVLEDSINYYIISEKCIGNDVADWLVRVQEEGNWLQEHTIADYIRQALIALAHAHSGRFHHLDFRPSSLALTSKMPDAKIKVCDLGLAEILDPDMEIMRRNSSPYMAPELLQGSVSGKFAAADMWSIGAVAHTLLVGHAPNQVAGPWQVRRKHVDPQEAEMWAERSIQSRQFVERLLAQAEHRPTAAVALQDAWLRTVVRLDAVRLSLGDAAARELQRRLLVYMLSAMLMPVLMECQALQQFRLAFEAADADQDGLVSRAFVHRMLRERGVSSEASAAALDVADVCSGGVLDIFAAGCACFVATEFLSKDSSATNLVPEMMKLLFRTYGNGQSFTASSLRAQICTSTMRDIEAHTKVSYDDLLSCLPAGEIDYQKLLAALSCSAGFGTALSPADQDDEDGEPVPDWSESGPLERLEGVVNTLFYSCGIFGAHRTIRARIQ